MPKTNNQSQEKEDDTPEPHLTLHQKVNTQKVLDLLKSDVISENDVRVLLDFAKTNGELDVDYFRSETNNALYAKTGLSNMRAEARAYLCAENYIDVDFVNCCPTILLAEIQANEPDLEAIQHLEQYVNRRQESLNELKSYQMDKRSILAIINGAKIRKDLPSEITEFLNGVQRCADRLFAIKSDRLFLQKKQAEYLDQLLDLVKSVGCEPVALVQDSIIIKKKRNLQPLLIDEWNSTHTIKIKMKEWQIPEINSKKEFNWNDPVFFNDLNQNTFYKSKQHALIANLKTMVKTIIVSADWKTAVVKKHIRSQYGYERKYDIIKTKDIGIVYNLIKDEKEVDKTVGLVTLMKTIPSLFTVSQISSFPTTDPDTFSLFRGFIPQDKARPRGDLTRFFEPVRCHMKEVWCQDNSDYFKWLENWLAFIIQKCPAKTQTIVQITGDEGTGKSCLFEWLVSKIFGELCIVLSGCDKLTRNFNAHLLGKVLVCLEEVSGDKHDLNRIKHIATGDFLDIERKGIDVDTDINAINIICFSNLDNPLPPVTGINRRLVHFRANTKYIKDKEYFKELIKFLNTDPIAPIAFYHYYKEYKIDEDYLFNNKPVTEEKNFNRFMSLSEVDRAIYYILANSEGESVEVKAKDIVEKCKMLWDKSTITPVAVGRRLNRLGFSKKQEAGINKYHITTQFMSYDKELADLCSEFAKDNSIMDLDQLIN